MNTVNILIQSKDDPKNLLTTAEKAKAFPEGLTVVFIEGATQGGQLGIELIYKGQDIFGKETIMGHPVTEMNWEKIMGIFIAARMRFGRMPEDQWEMVRHYVKEQVTRFRDQLPEDKQKFIDEDLKKFFRI
jgi:hypothetical protein